MRVVLDANILFVSVSEHSPYYPIFQALINAQYDLVITTDIMLEYDEVIRAEMGAKVTDNLMAFLSHAYNVIKITKYYYWNLITIDPDDNKFVDAAIAGNADFIVTEDRHFRVLKKIAFPSVKVISIGDFLQLLQQLTPQ